MNPIIDKIKKLLRLGRNSGASAAESATALQKAQQLAAEHGIDLTAIPADADGNGGMTHVTEASQAGPAHVLAAGLVRHHFGVDTLFDSTGAKAVIHFIGIESNCQIAAYVYVFLVRSMRAAWRKRTNRRLRDRGSFLRGYATAVHQMMPAKFHQPGLVVCSKRYVEGVLMAGKPGVRITEHKHDTSKRSDASYREGYIAGTDAGINNAVRGTNTELIA